jgi:oligoribonuclease
MDLEMTGLNPDVDVIVEIATIVTDDDLNVVAEGPHLVIHHSDDVLSIMDPFVLQMHTESGLLPLIRESHTTVADAARLTLDFIRTHVSEPRTVPLCGNSIGTDRRFLAKYMPDIEAFLHYRSVDVSSVKELCKRWYPTVTIDRPSKAGAHRALNDILESVRELRFYRENIFTASAGGNGPSAPADPAAND